MFLLQMIKDCGSKVLVKFRLRDGLIDNGVQDAWKEYYMYPNCELICFQSELQAAAYRGVVTIYKTDDCSLIDDDGKRKEVVTGYRSSKLYKLNI